MKNVKIVCRIFRLFHYHTFSETLVCSPDHLEFNNPNDSIISIILRSRRSAGTVTFSADLMVDANAQDSYDFGL